MVEDEQKLFIYFHTFESFFAEKYKCLETVLGTTYVHWIGEEISHKKKIINGALSNLDKIRDKNKFEFVPITQLFTKCRVHAYNIMLCTAITVFYLFAGYDSWRVFFEKVL